MKITLSQLQPAMQSQDSRMAALEKTLVNLEAERDQLAEERSLLEAEKAELTYSLQTSEKGLQALQQELERNEKAEGVSTLCFIVTICWHSHCNVYVILFDLHE